MPGENTVVCPKCGTEVKIYRNPFLTVDIIINIAGEGIVLIERKNPPYGWALPGGFVDYGESLERAAYREAMEETGLILHDLKQFRAYSAADRDPRHHTVTMVFSATGVGEPKAADDAQRLRVFSPNALPAEMAFDHGIIIRDFLASQNELFEASGPRNCLEG